MSETTEQVQNQENAQPKFTKKPGGKPKKRVCQYCAEKSVYIDYKDSRLRRYVAENGKIIARRQMGTCAKHQRELTTAIKRARNVSLI